MTAKAQKRAIRERAVARLREAQAASPDGKVGRALVEEAARSVGCSPASLYRDLKRGEIPAPNGRERYELSRRELLAVAAYGGKRKPAYRTLCEGGAAPPVKYEAFNKAYKELPEAFQTGIVHGQQKAKRFLLYSEVGRPEPGTIAELDGWEPNILVRASFRRSDADQPMCRPHVFALVDRGSELILAATVKFPQVGERAQLDDEFVAASLVSATRVREIDPLDLPFDGVELPWDWKSVQRSALQIGGVMPTIFHDNAKALISKSTCGLADAVGFELKKVPPYTGEAKPYIERLFGTLETGHMFLLPGQTHGPKTRSDGQAWEGHATSDDFVKLLERVVFEHNFLRPQKKLGDRTPFQVWAEAAPSLRIPDDDVVRPFRMLHPHKAGKRKVGKWGVMVDSRWYQADELIGWIGKKSGVRVRIDPQDRSFVDVWTVDDEGNERFLTCAYLNRDRPVEEKREMLVQNLQMQKESRELVREAGEVRDAFALIVRDGTAPADAVVQAIDAVLDEDSEVATELARLLSPDNDEELATTLAERFAQALVEVSDRDAVPADLLRATTTEPDDDSVEQDPRESDDASDVATTDDPAPAEEPVAELTALPGGAELPTFDPRSALAAVEREAAAGQTTNGKSKRGSRRKAKTA